MRVRDLDKAHNTQFTRGGEIHMPKINRKQTSATVARKASSLLRDGRTSAKTKSVAASALSQTKPSNKK